MEVNQGIVWIQSQDTLVFSYGVVSLAQHQIGVREAIFISIYVPDGWTMLERLFEKRNSFSGVAGLQIEVVIQELWRSEEHTSELQSLAYLVCRLLLEKKKKTVPLDDVARISRAGIYH